MATLPSATVRVDDQAVAAAGVDYVAVAGPVGTNADGTPRLFSSVAALLSFHGYSPAVDYSAMHMEETGLPVLFVPLAVGTAGVVSQQDDSGVTGTSLITVTGTPLEECDLELVVTTGGTIGTDAIKFDLSLDGGRVFKAVRLGTASSYAIPRVGITLAFAAGTLVADDTYTARTTAPRWAQAGLQAGRENLAAQQKQFRSLMVIGDCADVDDANDIVTEINAYETSNDRFVYARAQVRDQYAAAKLSNVGTITFAEVGATGDTITRSAGSFLADGFKVGDILTIDGSASNDQTTDAITGVTATVITLNTSDLVAEGPVAAGTVTITAPAETKAAWRSDIDLEFDDVSDEKRIDLGAGRMRKLSPITGYRFRRSVQWAASIREYQHDVQIPCWRKSDGPLSGWDLYDEDGILMEHDERVDGGLLAARFTCARTWSNGPTGAFIALSLTRRDEGSLLSRTHNMAVTNVACTVCQAETENSIGEVLVLNADGTGTEESLKTIEARVNRALAVALLQPRAEGPRASSAKWTASRSDILNVPGAELTGVLALNLLGTIEKITTTVKIATAGA